MSSEPHASRPAASARVQVLRLVLLSALIVAFVAVYVLGGGGEDGGRSLGGKAMGTSWTVKLGAQVEDAEMTSLRATVERVLGDVDSRMSTWKPDSELSRFNAHRSNAPFSVSPDVARVFAAAARISQLTEGAFDVTVAPLVRAWGFGAGAEKDRDGGPDPASLAALRPRIGHGLIRVDESEGRLTKGHPLATADLSAIAKGFAVDRVALALEAQGVSDYLVEIGGEVRVRGHSSAGTPWRLGIERPLQERRTVHAVIALDGQALATSGTYRNYRRLDGGKVISHLIDPRTMAPTEHALVSVSVVRPECMDADALATALHVMGPEAGLALAERENITALFIARDPSGRLSEQMTGGFAALRAPHDGPAAGVAR